MAVIVPGARNSVNTSSISTAISNQEGKRPSVTNINNSQGKSSVRKRSASAVYADIIQRYTQLLDMKSLLRGRESVEDGYCRVQSIPGSDAVRPIMELDIATVEKQLTILNLLYLGIMCVAVAPSFANIVCL